MWKFCQFVILLLSQVKALSANQAAAQAIQLFSQEARLCDAQPTKVARTQSTLSTKNEYERMASDDSSDSKLSKDVISQETRTSTFQKLGTLSQGCEIGKLSFNYAWFKIIQ